MTEPKIIAFVSSEEHLGMPAILSGLAAAISALDSQLVLVDGATGEIGLRNGTGEFDYVLVDIPFEPAPFAGAVLSGCDLVMVACSCKLDYIDAANNIVKGLLFLGIAPEKTAALLVDPEGMLSGASLDGCRTYVETSLGIKMAGGISFDAKAGEISPDFLKLADYILARARRVKEPAAQIVVTEISL